MDPASVRTGAVASVAAEVLRYGLIFIHQHANDPAVVAAVTDLLEGVPRLIYDPGNRGAQDAARRDVIDLARRFPRSGFVARARVLDVALGSGAPSLARIN